MLLENAALVREKLEALIKELKLHGFWKAQSAPWVHDFARCCEVSEAGFFEWLQFVYIPNKLFPEVREALPRVLVMTQARPFLMQSQQCGSIIRLMVELDGL